MNYEKEKAIAGNGKCRLQQEQKQIRISKVNACACVSCLSAEAAVPAVVCGGTLKSQFEVTDAAAGLEYLGQRWNLVFSESALTLALAGVAKLIRAVAHSETRC